MAKPKLTMTWTDKGWARIFNNAVREGSVHVRAGSVGAKGAAIHPMRAGTPHQMTVATVAGLHEFGLGGMPRRSYIRAALLWDPAARREFQYLMGEVSINVLYRNVPRRVAMQKVGDWAVKRIKDKILSNVPPALADFTVDRKGHDHALIHSDTLYDSIDYEVQPGKGGD